MMTLPFVAAFAALVAAWGQRHGLAALLWLVSVVLLLTLFRLHATDPLDIVL
jgi:hypothetical protein